MFEPAAMNAEFRDIEEMVRAAGEYVEVSDVLRADTLEEARNVNRQTSARLWLLGLAAAVAFMVISTAHLRSCLASTLPVMAEIRADSEQMHTVALQNAAQTDVDPSWAVVDAFHGLRQRQASLIDDVL